MTQELMSWLRGGNILVGEVEKNGAPWWYRSATPAEQQAMDDLGILYPGEVPVGDIQRRQFDWTAVSQPLFVPGEVAEIDGKLEVLSYTQVPGRQAILRSDNRAVLGIFGDDYKPHPYGEWLIQNVSALVQGSLRASSSGVLKAGAIAWVQFEADDLTHESGVRLRPHLLATTSLNGEVASTYKWNATNVVCDNTHRLAMGEATPEFRVYHTRNSAFDETAARRALGLLDLNAQAWQRELDELTHLPVSPREWDRFLDVTVPLTKDGENLAGRALTFATKKRDQLQELWRTDERVAPWQGRAWGVVQAWNTWDTHYAMVSGMGRPERQRQKAVIAGENPDAYALSKLDVVMQGGVTQARQRIAAAETHTAALVV